MITSIAARPIKDFIGILKDWLDDTNVYVQPNHLSIHGVDAEKVALIHFDLHDPKIADTCIHGINIASLYKFIRNCDKADVVVFGTCEEGLRVSVGMSQYVFKNLIIPTDVYHVNTGDATPFTIETRQLQRVLREIGNGCSIISMELNQNALSIFGKSDEGTGRAIIPCVYDGPLLKYEYFYKYIEKFTRYTASKHITIWMKPTGALILGYKKTFNKSAEAALHLVLAPIET